MECSKIKIEVILVVNYNKGKNYLELIRICKFKLIV